MSKWVFLHVSTPKLFIEWFPYTLEVVLPHLEIWYANNHSEKEKWREKREMKGEEEE